MNLTEYARTNRYRTRNLHDGRPVPPCWVDRRQVRMPNPLGEPESRCTAIVGHDGYVFSQDGRLEVYLTYKSGRGVKSASLRLVELGGKVTQEGDTELGGTAPVEQIEAVCRLIRAARRPKGNPRPDTSGLVPRKPSNPRQLRELERPEPAGVVL